MLSKKHLMVIILVFLGVTLIAGVAFAKRKDGFEGAWYGEDTYDPSHMWLWITNHSGVYEVLWYDDGCSACSGGAPGPSCLIVASGHKGPDPNTLYVDGGNLYCYWDEGVELLEGYEWNAIQTYNPGKDTIHQEYTQTDPPNPTVFITNWTRINKKKPEQVIDPVPFPKPTP